MVTTDTRLAQLKSLANLRIGTILLLGFSSGLPLALTGGTLQAWMTVEGVDLKTIGIFTLVGVPYTFKFLWAPFLDRFVPPVLGRRRGWILIFQLTLMALIVSMSGFSPKSAPWVVAFLAPSASDRRRRDDAREGAQQAWTAAMRTSGGEGYSSAGR